MKRFLLWALLAVVSVVAPSGVTAQGEITAQREAATQGEAAAQGEVTVHKLSNGMEVWFSEDHSAPTVVGMVVVRAGAKNCPDTGIAHYFEHIMFKGTDKIGTVDYAKEKPLLDSIAAQYVLLRETSDSQARADIQSDINRLSIEAAKYAIPNEFANLTTLFGGSMLNAGTSYDYTVYYNLFSPHNMEPWLELNSERLVNPVFRMFQSELETVYEEKNMYSDFLGSQAIEKVQEMLFAPHPYSKPVIGSTENLKNPDLDAMRKFYQDYYVAGNMALILNGDFDTAEVLPLVERYFSRIPVGEAPVSDFAAPRPFSGREEETVKLPIPLIQAGVTAWRTVPVNHPDEVALSMATTILSNSNSTGYLDKLMKEGDVMAAALVNMGMNDAGVAVAIYVPGGLVFGLNKAESKVLKEIERLRTGDFTDEEFSSAKLEYAKGHVLGLEDFRNRASAMASVFASGMTWDEYLERQEKLLAVTKEDIMAVADKYLSGDKLVLRKKTGSYKKDELESPDFEPVEPQREITRSEYAEGLVEKYTSLVEPRFIDVESDVERVALANGDELFLASNPYNDVFTMTVSYRTGYNNIPAAEYLSGYIDYLGTDSMTAVEFQEKLRRLGTNVYFGASSDRFNIMMSGFDDNFAESYGLLKEFVNNVVPDKTGFNSMLSMKKMEDRTVAKDGSFLNDALEEYVLYGDNSSILRGITAKEMKRHKKEGFLRDFAEICSHNAGVYYSGALSSGDVAAVIGNGLVENGGARTERAFYPVAMTDESAVYLINTPKARQSGVNVYIDCGEIDDVRDRTLAALFNMYVGGSMNSMMFRELREFRSFAYSASSRFIVPRRPANDHTAVFACYLTTQLDKTLDALGTLDSLIAGMMFTQEQFESARTQIINDIHNSYPSFRDMGYSVDRFLEDGYTQDPRIEMFRLLSEFTVDDLREFYSARVRERPRVVAVTTDTKQLKPEEFSSYGNVEVLKPKNVLRK